MTFDQWLEGSFLQQEMDVPQERAVDYCREAYEAGLAAGYDQGFADATANKSKRPAKPE